LLFSAKYAIMNCKTKSNYGGFYVFQSTKSETMDKKANQQKP
jgi:hypothetical protein